MRLQIWDTAGSEVFRSIARSYYKGAAGIVMVFDLGRRATFEDLKMWLAEVKEAASSTATFILVGNKCDLEESKIQVTSEEVEHFADSNSMQYIESSAKTGKNIENIFDTIAAAIYKKIKEKIIDVAAADQGVRVGKSQSIFLQSNNAISSFCPC
eukprot:TRINITY_DN8851_c0_g3_i6.p2 TRINITY_DN8851_c0_g3~~TRINITY_DN8851_c0_g3_i6.p2  ORF type:complete len:155 (+),score=36.67 TRINITY_DN8851_c0_g3_i6:146-610(+)